MEKVYTEKELDKMKFAELKRIASIRCLKQGGRKYDLAARILEDQKSTPKQENKNLRDNTYFGLLPADIINELTKYRIENEPYNRITKKLIESIDPSPKEIEKLNALLYKHGIPYSLGENEEREKLFREARRLEEETDESYYMIRDRLGLFEIPFFTAKNLRNEVISEQSFCELIAALLTRKIASLEFINQIIEKCESDIVILKIRVNLKYGKKSYKYKIGHFKSMKEFSIP
jgi:hypothetical protein